MPLRLQAGWKAREPSGAALVRHRGVAVARGRWGALIAVEAALGLAVAFGVPGANVAAALLMAFFAAALLVALALGRGGQPCACFGSRSRIGLVAVTRAVLAAGLAALPVLNDIRPAAETWLEVGLVIALVALALGGVALFALAREVGELRLTIAPQHALALEGEGPALGSRLKLIERFEGEPELALAFFASTTCRLCSALNPALRLIETEPGVSSRSSTRTTIEMSGKSSRSPEARTASCLIRRAACSRRGRSTPSLSSKGCLRSPSVAGPGSLVSEPRFSDVVVGATTRRGFLSRVGRLLVSLSAGGLVAESLRPAGRRGIPLLRTRLHHRSLAHTRQAYPVSMRGASRCVRSMVIQSTTSDGRLMRSAVRSARPALSSARQTARRLAERSTHSHL